MIYGIVSSVILGLMALVIFLGVLKGRRYEWEYSAFRLVNIVVSAVASVILSSILGKTLADAVTKELISLLPAEAAEAFSSMPSALGLIGAFIAMFTAPLIFYIIFAIIRGIIGLFVPHIAYAVKKLLDKGTTEVRYNSKGKKLSAKKQLKTKKGGILGMVLGGVCALCMFIALTAPITPYITIVNGVMMMVGGGSEDETLSTAVSVTDALAENVGTKTVKVLGGDLLVSGMTSYKLADQKSNLNDEMEIVTYIGEAVCAVRDKSCDRAEAASTVRMVGDAFEETKFIPAATAELLDSASKKWVNGEKFAGVKAPSLGGNSEELTKQLCEMFVGSNMETVKKDVHTIADIFACIVETDALDDIKGNFISVLENEEVTQKVLFEILDNDHFDGIIGGLMSYGVDVLCDSLEVRHDMTGIYEDFLEDIAVIDAGTDPSDELAVSNAESEYQKVFNKYAIKVKEDCAKNAAIADVSGMDMAKWIKDQGIVSSDADFDEKSLIVTAADINIKDHVVTDKAAEAVKLAKALHSVVSISDQLKDSNDTVNTVIKLGPVLDAFAETETVGRDCTGKLLVALLQSDKVSKNIGFDHLKATEIAESINAGAEKGGYAAQMTTLAQTVDVLQAVSNKGNSKEAVSTLLKDLTPETAKTMQTVTTPSVMKENGVPEKSAEPAASMMSDILGGLSEAKEAGMSEEELNRETEAVNNVLNTAMNIDSSHETVFGEESATGVTAEQYVNDIMDSQVVSQTIIDHVYGEGDAPSMDPLNSERELNDSEADELVAALNTKWQNASAEEKADEKFNRSIIATAAIINVPVTITANGVVRA